MGWSWCEDLKTKTDTRDTVLVSQMWVQLSSLSVWIADFSHIGVQCMEQYL